METIIELIRKQTADIRAISADLNAQTSSINEVRATVAEQTSDINEVCADIREMNATIEQTTAKVGAIGAGLNAVRRDLIESRVPTIYVLHQPIPIVPLPRGEEPKPVEPFIYQAGIRGLTPRGALEPIKGKLSMDRLVRDRDGRLVPG